MVCRIGRWGVSGTEWLQCDGGQISRGWWDMRRQNLSRAPISMFSCCEVHKDYPFLSVFMLLLPNLVFYLSTPETSSHAFHQYLHTPPLVIHPLSLHFSARTDAESDLRERLHRSSSLWKSMRSRHELQLRRQHQCLRGMHLSKRLSM